MILESDGGEGFTQVGRAGISMPHSLRIWVLLITAFIVIPTGAALGYHQLVQLHPNTPPNANRMPANPTRNQWITDANDAYVACGVLVSAFGLPMQEYQRTGSTLSKDSTVIQHWTAACTNDRVSYPPHVDPAKYFPAMLDLHRSYVHIAKAGDLYARILDGDIGGMAVSFSLRKAQTELGIAKGAHARAMKVLPRDLLM